PTHGEERAEHHLSRRQVGEVAVGGERRQLHDVLVELAEHEELDQREEDNADEVGRHADEAPRGAQAEPVGVIDEGGDLVHVQNPMMMGWSAASSRMWRPVYLRNTSSRLGRLICRAVTSSPSPSRRRRSDGVAAPASGTDSITTPSW